ncbi:hypothetical protein PR048_033238 [Dryococelus australis]|uniref:Uncharacterized protein n=1 Tax=Dryococelus australis TaxID=614101 RepID=A0ABQ9FZQ9_9NEOP|nr:hypothetical protein PR048_033238 [Dryococelus australis]
MKGKGGGEMVRQRPRVDGCASSIPATCEYLYYCFKLREILVLGPKPPEFFSCPTPHLVVGSWYSLSSRLSRHVPVSRPRGSWIAQLCIFPWAAGVEAPSGDPLDHLGEEKLSMAEASSNLSRVLGGLPGLDTIKGDPPIKATWVRFRSMSLPRIFESCRTMPLADVFSRESPFPLRTCIPVLLHTHLVSSSPVVKTSLLRASRISSLTHLFIYFMKIAIILFACIPDEKIRCACDTSGTSESIELLDLRRINLTQCMLVIHVPVMHHPSKQHLWRRPQASSGKLGNHNSEPEWNVSTAIAKCKEHQEMLVQQTSGHSWVIITNYKQTPPPVHNGSQS